VAKALAANTNIDVVNVPLEDFVKALGKDHGISIRLDQSGLRRANVAPSTQITASFKQVPLGVALRLILRPLKLQHRISDGVVIIDDIGLPVDAPRPPRPGPAGPQLQAAPIDLLRGIQLLQGQPMRRAPAVVAAPLIARRVGVVNMNAEQGTLQQLRLVLQVELNFVKRVCAPTPEQMLQLKQEGLKQIADAAKAWQANVNNRRPVFIRNGQQVLINNGQPALNDARRSVQEKLTELVHARLSLAQASRYDSEIKKRNANLHLVCARNLVVALDQELCLTEWQRQKLGTELAGNWDDSWTMTVVLGSTNNAGFLPNIPDEFIVPYLDATQRSLWNSLPKRGNTVWGIRAAAFLGMTPPALDDQE
jgi:hypothetical protein